MRSAGLARKRIGVAALLFFLLISLGPSAAVAEIASYIDVETSYFSYHGDNAYIFIAVRQPRTNGSLRLICRLSQDDGVADIFDEVIRFPGSHYNFQTIRLDRSQVHPATLLDDHYPGPEPSVECRTTEERLYGDEQVFRTADVSTEAFAWMRDPDGKITEVAMHVHAIPFDPSNPPYLAKDIRVTCAFFADQTDSRSTLVRVSSSATVEDAESGERVARLQLVPPLASTTGYRCNLGQPANVPMYDAPG